MAIIVSDSNNPAYDGNLSTVNGFYRAEAGNLAAFSSAQSLTSTYNLSTTFANAGNVQGVVLYLTITGNCNRPLKVELQENVASVWTARTSVELTAYQINKSTVYTEQASAGYITAFKFPTPYAVDTTGGKWRFQITSTAGTGNWNVRQASAGNISYITWCDNQISYTNNADQFVAVDTLYLDQAATLKGILYTGDTVNAISGWVCSGSDKSITNVCRLKWDPTPASSYKVTVNGFIMLGTASGFQAGTEASPIPSAQMGHLEFADATVGTNLNYLSSGFAQDTKGSGRGGTILIYGEIPSVEDTELSVAASSGQPVVTTKVSTGWVNGDQVVIGRQTTKGNPDATIYTVSGVVGTTVTLTTNLATARAINASIFRLNGYGFKLSSSGTVGTRMLFLGRTNWQIIGCEHKNIQWQENVLAVQPADVGSVNLPYRIEHCSVINLTATTYNFHVSNFTPQIAGVVFNHCNFFKSTPFNATFMGNGQGTLTLTNNIIINHDAVSSFHVLLSGLWTYTDNKHENAASLFVTTQGFKGSFRRNKFYGSNASGGSAVGAVRMYFTFLFTDWGQNTYDNNATAISISNNSSFGVRVTADEFGQVTANSQDIWPYYRGLSDVHFDNCKGNIVGFYNSQMLPGFILRLSKINQTEGNDRFEMAEGIIYKAGTGLSDTTKHVGTYCQKWVPLSTWTDYAVSQMSWTQTVPTENIQNKDMMVGVWVNISNSAYWGGNYTMPTLTVDYDNGTTASAVAAQTTGWQFIFVPFHPATTYGQITVTIKGWSNASGTNGTFYIADMAVLYPAGHTIALGAMNTWAGALPVMPSISTSVSAADVWAADPDSFGAGTVGKKVNDIEIKADDASILGGLT